MRTRPDGTPQTAPSAVPPIAPVVQVHQYPSIPVPSTPPPSSRCCARWPSA
ncbi:MAG: hypothetical protein U0325_31835 [Polyangiales bacterium]